MFANGQPVSTATEASITTSRQFGADTFEVCIAATDDWASSIAYWSAIGDVVVDIQACLGPAHDRISLIQGDVDNVSVDPLHGLIRLEGRSLAARLIDSSPYEDFVNQTASDIVPVIAARHGLRCMVAATSGLVGSLYRDSHDLLAIGRSSRIMTDWDLVVRLAERESFDVFVRGDVLYFQPFAPEQVSSFIIRPDDVIDLHLERSLPLARAVEVVVRSWNSQKRDTFVGTAKSGAATNGVASDAQGRMAAPQRYLLSRPNLTAEDADRLAGQRLDQIRRQSRTIEFTMPGDPSLTPRTAVMLTGTGTAFDQLYEIEAISHTYSPRSGFVQRIRARLG